MFGNVLSNKQSDAQAMLADVIRSGVGILHDHVGALPLTS